MPRTLAYFGMDGNEPQVNCKATLSAQTKVQKDSGFTFGKGLRPGFAGWSSIRPNRGTAKQRTEDLPSHGRAETEGERVQVSTRSHTPASPRSSYEELTSIALLLRDRVG